MAIPRRLSKFDSPIVERSLHGFSDASEKAYGGIIHIRTLHHDASISIALLTSKTSVAPKKALTIPKLDLSGARLLAKLMKVTAEDLNIPPDLLYCWSDSTVTLRWIRQQSSRYKVFETNRVSEIQQLLPTTQW